MSHQEAAEALQGQRAAAFPGTRGAVCVCVPEKQLGCSGPASQPKQGCPLQGGCQKSLPLLIALHDTQDQVLKEKGAERLGPRGGAPLPSTATEMVNSLYSGSWPAFHNPEVQQQGHYRSSDKPTRGGRAVKGRVAPSLPTASWGAFPGISHSLVLLQGRHQHLWQDSLDPLLFSCRASPECGPCWLGMMGVISQPI